jgi:hypothetical protein
MHMQSVHWMLVSFGNRVQVANKSVERTLQKLRLWSTFASLSASHVRRCAAR